MKYTTIELDRIAGNMKVIADHIGYAWCGVWYECKCGTFNLRAKCRGCGSTDMEKYYDIDATEADEAAKEDFDLHTTKSNRKKEAFNIVTTRQRASIKTVKT